MGKHRDRHLALTESLNSLLDDDVDVALGTLPEDHQALSPLVTTAAQILTALQAPPPPPPCNLQPGRTRLLIKAAEMARAESRRWWRLRMNLSREMRFVGKVIAAVMILMMTLAPFSGQITLAAMNSMPGDLLYPLKIRTQREQFSSAELPDMQVTLGLAFLGERIAEIVNAVRLQREIPFEAIAGTQHLVNYTLIAVAQTPVETMPEMLNVVIVQLEGYVKILDQTSVSGSAEQASALQQIARACRRGYRIAQEARDNLDAFRQAYAIGRPELFLLPGEGPLGGPPALPQSHHRDADNQIIELY